MHCQNFISTEIILLYFRTKKSKIRLYSCFSKIHKHGGFCRAGHNIIRIIDGTALFVLDNDFNQTFAQFSNHILLDDSQYLDNFY